MTQSQVRNRRRIQPQRADHLGGGEESLAQIAISGLSR
jgi:hypothetical protein